MNELLALANMQDKQYEKIELDEVRQMLGVLKKAAFSLNADKLASKILNEAFINDLRASKLGRIYPLQK
jgi:ribosomal protein S3AE